MMSFETVRNEEKTMLRRLASLSLALVVAVGAISACDGGSQSGPGSNTGDAREHEVFCLGSERKCDATAATFCLSRYQTESFVLVRRVAERGSLVVICGAE